ncbi:hypothetical protein [Parabacteroides gordonii]|uniref:Uncharacterized protein n=1 Tax=Parabacteroides gordonii MS-1 = DSM 23371 TaxID=1203610 RepID=A0A0F5JKU5_9BACT|nr:hypothetical protein [Parabacteroides gordonii]KKB58334.1 hypothetical protein HMPREF1536_01209 [Parabacteroides gordonii MS-1 = DSM 23371]MCA5583395.1 hypothetical protein [Parabacteroides gordonii]RGP16067.1 hypothetical protein DXB27_13785 [Parabacteroides gordonii]
MEAENNSPVADTSGFEHIVQQFQQDISKDAYFEEESMRIKQAFSNTKQGEDQLLYLRHQLQCVKTFLTRLELPWDKYIPLLFRGFACYLQCEERKSVRSKNYRLSAELMECVAFLSQSGRLINSMANYYDKQIKEVEKKIAEKNIS